MSTTIKRAIAEDLENLSDDDFKKFVFLLRDRREEPRVSSRAVKGKNPLEIADTVVSHFTEPVAGLVAVSILRQMNFNQEAETLELKIKACVDKDDSILRKTLTGESMPKSTREVLKPALGCRSSQVAQCEGPQQKPEDVNAEEEDCILSEDGDACNDRLPLGKCTIQFGKYKNRTFEWLRENKPSYLGYLVASDQKENNFPPQQDRLRANKDSLARYAMAYPEVREEIRFNSEYDKAKVRSLLPGQEGAALVGFGPYRWETLKVLYESPDPDKIRFVNNIWIKKSTCIKGSKMDILVRYILKREKEWAKAVQTRRTAISSYKNKY
ncbi:uncharacterized protein LOC121513101 [Cheilinus undulatus]|uniref:uncharacterized protein LOC121513101 n=1 Tax=Cheilinus undulatus TaxID=241271 RepID=UPI001BD45116|nr:uncharacterized protein LOC121513101 [Cheilinus undulatus]